MVHHIATPIRTLLCWEFEKTSCHGTPLYGYPYYGPYRQHYKAPC